MPIESFHEMLVIDTPEAAENLVAAFRAAEKRGPYVPTCDIMKLLEEGDKQLPQIIENIRRQRVEKERREQEERRGSE